MKISKQTLKSYDSTYKNGYDKDYPSLELVRIEKIFFKTKGNVLDYGCGPGTNGIHFLKKGYPVTFCDISDFALKKTKQKILKLKIKKNFRLINITKNKSFFKNNLNYFDYIICFSVFNNFQKKEIAIKYVKKFQLLLKQNGKLIIDSNLKNKNNYKVVDKKRNIFTTNNNNSFNLKMFFPNRNEFIEMIKNSGFKICDIGYSNFKVFGSYEKEIIISAVKL